VQVDVHQLHLAPRQVGKKGLENHILAVALSSFLLLLFFLFLGIGVQRVAPHTRIHHSVEGGNEHHRFLPHENTGGIHGLAM